MKAPSFNGTDLGALVRLLSAAGDPLIDRTIAARKRAFFDGLNDLIESDAWIWGVGEINAEAPNDTMAVRLLDGGWDDSHERVEMLKLITHPSLQSMITGVINEALKKNQCLTHSRDQLFSDEEWAGCEAGKAWHAAGFDQFLCSICPLSDGSYSGVRFHRRLGRPPFSARDRAVVEVLYPNVSWLHPCGETKGCRNGAAGLSPRERQVMLLLLGGDSRKQVARKLTLSEHTVADYLKVIYRKLNVSSRAELLAMYVTGQS